MYYRESGINVRKRTDGTVRCNYPVSMRLSQFITEHLEEILVEWEAFAASLLAPGEKRPRSRCATTPRRSAGHREDIESDQTDLEQCTNRRASRRSPCRAQRGHDARRRCATRRL